jgi:DNA-binding transcriptional ArsR family regulator
MDETEYRQSRICRLLGNPVIYQLIVLLDNGGPTTPSMLAKRAGRSVQTISTHLAKLRTADLVRYDSDGKNVRYWLKHRGETRGLLKSLQKIVKSASRLARSFRRFENSRNVQVPKGNGHVHASNSSFIVSLSGWSPATA